MQLQAKRGKGKETKEKVGQESYRENNTGPPEEAPKT